jgi:Arylsulfotransferase (ASST)
MPQFPPPRSEAARRQRWRTPAAALMSITVTLALTATGVAAAAPTDPPPVTILSSQPGFGHGKDFFVTPTGDTATYAQGPEIIDTKGNVVWFHAAPAGLATTDFRTQKLRGQNVLTFWQGTEAGGVGNGTDYIYNDRYQQIATVSAGNGLHADAHEFLISPQNTALITAYQPATADLSSIGGPPDQKVVNGVVQEIDIATGRVLWQWNSAEHVPYSASEQPLPSSPSETWDWFHVNAVHLDGHGGLLVNARNTWATYDVSRSSGVQWTLGGKDSSFALQAGPGQTLDNAGEIFAWQHDPEALGNGVYTVFDNESAGAANTGVGSTAELGLSRVVRFKLDPQAHTATLLQSYNQPDALTAPSQGNGQTTADGNLVVGWGSLPYFSEYDTAGDLLFNAEFPTGVNTYRAYLQPWGGAGSGDGGSGLGGYGSGPRYPRHGAPHRPGGSGHGHGGQKGSGSR